MDCFYRVAIRGLYVNREGKFLLIQTKLGHFWHLPGGGLEHGEEIELGLKREFLEETGLTINSISEKPEYCFSCQSNGVPRFNLIYKIELDNLDFVKSDECIDLKFFDIDEIKKEKVLPHMKQFIKYFKG